MKYTSNISSLFRSPESVVYYAGKDSDLRGPDNDWTKREPRYSRVSSSASERNRIDIEELKAIARAQAAVDVAEAYEDSRVKYVVAQRYMETCSRLNERPGNAYTGRGRIAYDAYVSAFVKESEKWVEIMAERGHICAPVRAEDLPLYSTQTGRQKARRELETLPPRTFCWVERC